MPIGRSANDKVVTIYFKDGKNMSYNVDDETLAKIANDFAKSVKNPFDEAGRAGVYDARTPSGPTKLVLDFSQVRNIG